MISSSQLARLTFAVSALAAPAAHAQTTFADPEALVGVATPTLNSVLSGDFNGDGLVDVCGIDRGGVPWLQASDPAPLYISFGLGQRQFTSPQVIPTTKLLVGPLAVGDVDGDGDDDIAGLFEDRPVLLTFDGAGALTEVPGPGASTNRAMIQLHDADGDGDLDVYYTDNVTANLTATLRIASLEGGQWTGQGRSFPVSTFRFGVRDVNGDGIGDMVSAAGNYFYRLLTPGGLGSSVALGPVETGPLITTTSWIEFVDVNADGFLDVLRTGIPGFANPGRQIQLGSATGISSAQTLLLDVPGAQVIGTWEFNGDGLTDLYYTDPGGAWFVSYGTGALPYPPGVPMQGQSIVTAPFAEQFTSIELWGNRTDNAGDLDGDGRDDRLVWVDFQLAGGFLGQQVAYGLDGGFDPATQPLLDQDAEDAPVVDRLRAVDIDGDGDRDLVGRSFQGDDGLVLFENFGGMRFRPRARLGPPLESVDRIEVGDTDGNGIAELVVTGGLSRTLYTYEWDGSGDIVETSALTLFNGDLEVVQDLDMDGFDDVVILTPGEVEIYRGSVGGPVSTALLVPTTGDEVRFADLDGDGDVDMLSVGGSVDQVHENVSTPGGLTFAPAIHLPVFVDPFVSNAEILPVDWDLDGVTDDLVVREFTGVSLYIGGGALGVYGPPQRLFNTVSVVPGPFEERMDAADVDQDGDMDIVITPVEIAAVQQAWVIYNDTFGPAAAPEPISGGMSTHDCGVADLDDDGDVDAFMVLLPFKAHVVENLATPRSGVEFCLPSSVNGSGELGRLDVYGAASPTGDALRLVASSLPKSVFGIFLGGPNAAPPLAVPGSPGTLCLGADIGRYQRPGEIRFSGESGRMELSVGPDDLRSGAQLVPATAGLSWTFQAWHRDLVGGVPTNHLTSAVTVTYQ